MPAYKAAYPTFMPIQKEVLGGPPVYDPGVLIGEMMTVTLNPEFNSASLYGDDRAVVTKSAFRQLAITLNTTRIPIKAASMMFGETIRENNKTNISNSSDRIHDGGLLFVIGDIDEDGNDIYVLYQVYKAQFPPPNESYTTQGESISFNTPSMTGTGVALKNGDWRRKDYFATKEEAFIELAKRAQLEVELTPPELIVTSREGTETGKTIITVSPPLEAGRSYRYKSGVNLELPKYDEDASSGWTEWNGAAEIEGRTGEQVIVAEVSLDNKIKKAGVTTIISKAAEEEGA